MHRRHLAGYLVNPFNLMLKVLSIFTPKMHERSLISNLFSPVIIQRMTMTNNKHGLG